METIGQSCLELGVAEIALPGEPVSGDRHAIGALPKGAIVGVFDGLGHGWQAAKAAQIAAQTLLNRESESVIGLLEDCHRQLQGTRGVVMSIASFDMIAKTMTWLGIGNVEGMLFRRDPAAVPPREILLLRAGVVGHRFEQPFAAIVPVAPGDVLVFATDGLDRDIGSALASLDPAESTQRIADRLLEKYWKRTDDALVLVARYKGHSS